MTAGWRPLLDGAAAAPAWTAIAAIAGELAGVARDPAALADGALGADLAVFFYYLHAATGERRHRELGEIALDGAADALAASAMPRALFHGFVRIGWAVEHLRRRGWIEAPDDTCAAIDDALVSALERGERQHFDLMTGLAGQAVYAVERAPLGAAAQILERIGARLIAGAIAQPAGHAWHTDPQWMAPWQRAVHRDGFFDLGLSHGTPCAVRVLSEIGARGLAGADLVDSAVAWLLGCERSAAAPSGFPYFVGGAVESAPARLAWCYGDPGIALGLLDSARLRGRPAWATEAHRLAERAARVPLDGAGVRDAALCHGAAGLAHIFRRLGGRGGDPRYDGAARAWWAAALAMRRPTGSDAGDAGFRAFDVRQQRDATDHSLLTGSTGIGLALLAAVSDIEPMWDRVLLCSTISASAEEATP